MARDVGACRRDRRTARSTSTDDPAARDPRSRTRRTARPALPASVPSSPLLPCLKRSESAEDAPLKRSFSTQSASKRTSNKLTQMLLRARSRRVPRYSKCRVVRYPEAPNVGFNGRQAFGKGFKDPIRENKADCDPLHQNPKSDLSGRGQSPCSRQDSAAQCRRKRKRSMQGG